MFIKNKKYEYEESIVSISKKGGAYIKFPWNVREEFGKGRVITGSVCGVRVETIKESLMQEIRYLDKLVDELAKGKTMEKILRKQ